MLVFVFPGQTTEQWFATGQPELLASAEGLTALMTWSDYAALTKNLTGLAASGAHRAFQPSPTGARFAINFVLGGKNRALAIDGSDDAGYRFYADTNGDGRLTDDEMLPMTRVAGRYIVRFQSSATESLNGVTETYPVEMTFTIDTAIPPGETAHLFRSFAAQGHDGSARKRVLAVGARRSSSRSSGTGRHLWTSRRARWCSICVVAASTCSTPGRLTDSWSVTGRSRSRM